VIYKSYYNQNDRSSRAPTKCRICAIMWQSQGLSEQVTITAKSVVSEIAQQAFRLCVSAAVATAICGTAMARVNPVDSTANELLQVLIPSPADKHAQLDTLYADSRQRIVMQYDLGRVVQDRTYFSDGGPSFDIDEEKAAALANTPFLISRFVADHGLTPLYSVYAGVLKQDRWSIHQFVFDGRACQWPYANGLVLERQGKPPVEIIFLRRRKVPMTDQYEFWCERGPGRTELTTKFENIVPLIYATADGSAVVAFRHPAVVFRLNADGGRLSSHPAEAIIAVQLKLSQHLLNMAAEAEITPQEAVQRFEALVETPNDPYNQGE